jgi:predicted porin
MDIGRCPEKKRLKGEILMQKKVMAVAVAAALGAPAAAFAQASSVQIYGKANLGFDNYRATGSVGGSASDYKARNRVFDSGSRIGFRGTEDLGNGLRAIFVIESGANIDAGTATTQSGSANSSAGTLASRDSYVGLEGGWGRLTFGRQSIYWQNGPLSLAGCCYINASVPQPSGTFGRINGPVTRQSNVVQYTSPTWAGFNATLSYSPTSEAVQQTGAGAAALDTNGKITGVTLRYTGFLNAQLDWAKNKRASNATPVTPGDVDGLKGGVGWPYAPGAQVAFLMQRLKQDRAATVAGFSTSGDNLKQQGWSLMWEHIFGNVQALAEYARTGYVKGCTESAGAVAGVAGSTCAQTRSRSWMVGAKYLLSKRTGVYVSYNSTSNDANQVVDYIGGGYTATTGLPGLGGAGASGADPRIWAVGIDHRF